MMVVVVVEEIDLPRLSETSDSEQLGDVLKDHDVKESRNRSCQQDQVGTLVNEVPKKEKKPKAKPRGRTGSPEAKKLKYCSIKHYGAKRYQNACGTPSCKLPFFKPCVHEGECTLENCSCVQNNHFCTLDCVNGRNSKNFFRGCDCSGSCGTNQCSCHAANRECDPEVCKCNLCRKGKCKNANMVLGAQPFLRIADSNIPGAGLGCFACNDFKKGDFIGEYTGEVLCEDEAAQREAASEAKGKNYLFSHSTDRVLDGKSLGNATRFINHATKGFNVKPRGKWAK